MHDPVISVVTPMYNEKDNIGVLLREIAAVFSTSVWKPYEIIIVDDASTDRGVTVAEQTWNELHNGSVPENTLSIIKNPVRSGQFSALMQGIRRAQGALIITMDSDLQNDPADIPRLLAELGTNDLICGIRLDRHDTAARRFFSRIANVFRNLITGDSTTDSGCMFRIMRKECVPAVLSSEGLLFGCEALFFPHLIRKKGFRVVETAITHRQRRHGNSRYRLIRGRLFRGLAACVRVGVTMTVALCMSLPALHAAPVPAAINPAPLAQSARTTININSNWLFAGGDIPNGQSDTLNESMFEPVCLPHANRMTPHVDIDVRSFQNISWYRRHFSLPASLHGKRFFIEFQGVSQVATVYVNGRFAGEHKGAYTPFTLDITDKVKFDADNVLSVKVDSRKHKEIPPEGLSVDYLLFGGIARDVSMIITGPVHIAWLFASRDSAMPDRVDVRAKIVNNGLSLKNAKVMASIEDSSGAVVATANSMLSIRPDSSYEFHGQTGGIVQPKLWDIDHPYLYTVRMRVLMDSAIDDEYTDKIGLRSIAFSKSDGKFRLNGRWIKLRGLNRHETYPFIGRAAANRLQVKDADLLKYELGCTIVRCSHYPQDPEFLQRCDEIGLLVLEEIPGWLYVGEAPWQAVALKNVEEMVVRDRNHPSIISFGVRINESADMHNLYVKTNRLARTLDLTRPTHGVRVPNRGSPTEFLEDVFTQNFQIPTGKPAIMPWLITESVGVHCPAHSWDSEDQLIRQMLRFAGVQDSVAANENIAGALGWCAFDYNSSHFTAEHSINYHGVADIFRIPKYAGYFFRSEAEPSAPGGGPMVYIAHSWKKAAAPHAIWVVSNCEKVELFVNGRSLGRKSPEYYRSLPHPLFAWNSVIFKPGELKAVGYIKDTVAATFIRKTPGKPVALRLVPDDTVLTDGGDMTRVVITAIDTFGQTVPRANNSVSIFSDGPADFFGESPIALEDGKTAFFVKTRSDETGMATFRAQGDGLTSDSIRVRIISDPGAVARKRILGK